MEVDEAAALELGDPGEGRGDASHQLRDADAELPSEGRRALGEPGEAVATPSSARTSFLLAPAGLLLDIVVRRPGQRDDLHLLVTEQVGRTPLHRLGLGARGEDHRVVLHDLRVHVGRYAQQRAERR